MAALLQNPQRLALQQHALNFAHLVSLKQPLQMNMSLPVMPQSVPTKASRPAEDTSLEPSPKRLAIDLNCALEYVDEDEEEELEDRSEELPDECMAQIFGLLEDVKDRMSCAMVCRRWLHLISLSRKRKAKRAAPPTPPAFAQQAAAVAAPYKSGISDSTEVVSGLSRTLEGRSASDSRLMAMAIALSDKGGLEKLVVRGSKRSADGFSSVKSLPLTASGFQAIASVSPNLRSVAIWDCDWLDDEVVTVIARLCRRLEKLDIMNCPRLSDKSLVALSKYCPNLSVLSLSACRMVTDQGLQVFAKGCKGLTSLSLTNCPHVMGKGVGVVAALCRKLTSMKLAGGMGLTNEGFRFIGENAASLARLRLYQLKNLTEEGFKALGETQGFQKLASLSVAACNGLTAGALEAIGRGCSALKTMGLVGCVNVTDRGLLALLKRNAGLESVTLQMLPGISNEAARFALEHGKHLRSLTISNCPGVKDSVTGAADWAIKCPELSSLKVANCRAMGNRCLSSMGRAGASLASLDLCGLPLAGDKGVLSFLESSSKKLSSIDLSGCCQITDKAVASIADRCGENVRSLCLDGCSKVTDKGLRALAKDCTGIEDLDLSKCDITDRGLKVLLAAVGPSLVNLSLAGCVKISDKSVEEIMDSCHSLSGLNLKNCSGLSKKAVDRLRQQAVTLFGPTCLFIDP